MSKLYFRYGAMGSGKTIDLLKVAYNYKERGQKVIIFTAKIDNRYEVGKITTRIGIQADALTFDNETNFYRQIKQLEEKPDCILIDESQFLNRKQVLQLSDVVDFLDIPVICYGLRSDFQMKFFTGSGPLMEMADKIEEIKTICECGKKATINMRMINGVPTTTGSQVLIGGNDSYKSVCRKCYKKLTHHVPGI
ncbi:MAG: thymidine kinase [Clostridia bacterium]|nr:thymidine kinase [Clostridia bacterium]